MNNNNKSEKEIKDKKINRVIFVISAIITSIFLGHYNKIKMEKINGYKAHPEIIKIENKTEEFKHQREQLHKEFHGELDATTNNDAKMDSMVKRINDYYTPEYNKLTHNFSDISDEITLFKIDKEKKYIELSCKNAILKEDCQRIMKNSLDNHFKKFYELEALLPFFNRIEYPNFKMNIKIEKDVNETKNTIVDTVNNSKDAIIAEFQKNKSREKKEIELKFVKSSMDDTKLCLNAKDVKQCIESVVKKHEANQQIFNNSQNSVDTLNKK